MAWWVYPAILIASQIYHRLTEKDPAKPKSANDIQIPKIEDGASLQLIYGRCRVRAPLLAYTSSVLAADHYAVGGGPAIGVFYCMDLFMILGIPFEQTSSRLWNMWSGELKFTWFSSPFTGGEIDHSSGSPPYTGPGASGTLGEYSHWILLPPVTDNFTTNTQGDVQFYDGRADQSHTAGIYGRSYLGRSMIDNGAGASSIPGFRGYLSLIHINRLNVPLGNRWIVGDSPSLSGYSYEVSSYPADSTAFNVGLEANPARVLLDLLIGTLGKLHLDASRIDYDSFSAAAIRLQEEGNGYSRALEGGGTASDLIAEILEQIDATLYEDPRDSKIRIKLIRDDYDWSALIGVTTENCEELTGFAAGCWDSIITKVRVVFTDRSRDYHPGSATAHNQAKAFSGEEVRELVIQMPGVCTQALANELAARELAARSRPIAKCRAVVDRTFAGTMPGDPIRVTWPEYGIDGRVFRVAAVNRGTLANGKIALDLIEDFFYVWRNVLVPGHPVKSFPGTTGTIGGFS